MAVSVSVFGLGFHLQEEEQFWEVPEPAGPEDVKVLEKEYHSEVVVVHGDGGGDGVLSAVVTLLGGGKDSARPMIENVCYSQL